MYELCGYGAVRGGGEGEGRIVPGRVSGRCCPLCDLPSVLGGAGSEVRGFPAGRGTQLLSGSLCVATRVSGSEIQCNSWPNPVSCVFSVIAGD